MDNTNITIRWDDGRREYVIELNVKGLGTFETTGGILSEAFQSMAEILEGEGV